MRAGRLRERIGALGLRLAARALPWLPAIAVLLIALDAWARVGGGGGFHGSSHSSSHSSGFSHSSSSSWSSHSSSSSSSGDGGDFAILIWFLFAHPQIGIPIAIIVVAIVVAKGRAARAMQDWSTSASGGGLPPMSWPTRGARRALAGLRRFDPDFSMVTLEDFLYALYARVHELRGARRLDDLACYVAPEVRARYQALHPDAVEVQNVIVGAMQLLSVAGLEGPGNRVTLRVRFESNFTDLDTARRPRTWYAAEVWTLGRRRDAKSRPPDRARVFGCPNCGAALSAVRGDTCSYCGKVVDTGEFDWRVESVQIVSLEPRPATLDTSAPEEGTELPTLVDPSAQARLAEVEASGEGQFRWADFQARVALAFTELQQAWSARDWTRARPYVTDNLFQMELYWMEGFQRRGVRNVIEDLEIGAIQLARVERDAWFDAITVRIYASCRDFFVSDADGKVVGGEARRRRRFSEYWTFVRGVGKGGAARADQKCPNCGAPLKINQAGICEYCQVRVTSGEFDWVLSRIEQDEAYEG